MHLAEAFLQTLAVRDDQDVQQALLQLCEALQTHFIEPERAGSERSQMFETPVANLAEAGEVLAKSPTFVECTAEHFMNHALGLQWGVVTYDRALLRKVAVKARAGGDPSLGAIVVALFSDPQVMQSIGHTTEAKAAP